MWSQNRHFHLWHHIWTSTLSDSSFQHFWHLFPVIPHIMLAKAGINHPRSNEYTSRLFRAKTSNIGTNLSFRNISYQENVCWDFQFPMCQNFSFSMIWKNLLLPSFFSFEVFSAPEYDLSSYNSVLQVSAKILSGKYFCCFFGFR